MTELHLAALGQALPALPTQSVRARDTSAGVLLQRANDLGVLLHDELIHRRLPIEQNAPSARERLEVVLSAARTAHAHWVKLADRVAQMSNVASIVRVQRDAPRSHPRMADLQQARELRDRAFTHLEMTLAEIAELGARVFRDTESLRLRFLRARSEASEQTGVVRVRATLDAEAAQPDDVAGVSTQRAL